MFLHFFHDQILKTAQQATLFRGRENLLIGRLKGAVALSALFADGTLLVPTVDLVQSPFLDKVSDVIQPLVAAESLVFVGSTVDVDELQVQKRVHFANTGLHQVWNKREARDRLIEYKPALRSRGRNTTSDLMERWTLDIADLDEREATREGSRQFRLARNRLPTALDITRFQRSLELIPDRLDGRAFLWNVFEASKIVDFGPAGLGTSSFERGMAYNWLLSHIEEYDTSIVGRIPGLNPIDFGLAMTHPTRVIDLGKYDDAFTSLGLRTVLPELTIHDVIALRKDIRFGFFLDTVVRPLAQGREHPMVDVALVKELRDAAMAAGEHQEGLGALEPILQRFWGTFAFDTITVRSAQFEEAMAKVRVRLAEVADYQRFQKRVDTVVEALVSFVESRMNLDRTRGASSRAYLFGPHATERDLQTDLDDYLRDRLPGAKVEFENRLNGGRVDLLVHYGDVRFPIELKRELNDGSEEGVGQYLAQAVSYTATDSTLGFLVVLDLTAARHPMADLRDNIWVEEVTPTRTGDRSRHVVVARVPGNRVAPSGL